MRILFSLTYYSPYISGLTLYVKRLAEELVKNGYQSEVLSCQYDKSLKTHENIGGVRVIRTKPLFKISKGFISLDWVVRSLQEVRENDAIIINLPQAEGIIPAFFGKLFGKKVISIYHCEVVMPEGFINKLSEMILNLANFLTLFLSDKVVTYTKDFAQHSKMLPQFFKKTHYIYPPIVKLKVNRRVQNIITKKIGKRPKFLIGVAARLAAEKGLEYLFEAIPFLNSELKFKIVIAGSLDPVGEESYKRKILKLVEKSKDDIIFLGEIKEEDMGSFYSLLDVLVLPSINSTEGFGMVQVEAMMMGVPVVASDLPGVRVPIQKTGMGLLVPVKNSPKLAEATVEILLNRKKYTKNAYFVRKEFAFDNTISFYNQILNYESGIFP